MIVQIRIDPEDLENIRLLIDEGHYKDIHEFVLMSIKNQINLDFDDSKSVISLGTTKTDAPLKFEFSLPTMTPADGKKSNVNTQYEVYGPGTSGLIWIFQNRFFPIKVALQCLSEISEGNDSVEFDTWKTSAGTYASDISSRLFKLDNKTEAIIGLPTPQQKLDKKFSKKRNKEALVSQKLEATKKRFVEQFVGRLILNKSKDSKEPIFSGACFEMGLVSIKENTDPLNPKISLSNDGFAFLNLSNPIFEKIKSNNIEIYNKIFSQDEINFIKKKIIPKFELEEIIMKELLEFNDSFSNHDIEKIFKTIKTNYYRKIDTRKLKEIEKKYESDIKIFENKSNIKNLDEMSDNITIAWIAQRYLEFQIITTIGRLIELNLIKREYHGREPKYYVPKTQLPDM